MFLFVLAAPIRILDHCESALFGVVNGGTKHTVTVYSDGMGDLVSDTLFFTILIFSN